MIIISSTELRRNLKKYLDIAATQKERIIVHRGKYDTYELYLHTPNKDIEQLILMDKSREESGRQL